MVLKPKCHTKSPKYILFSNHQIALLNNQNNLFFHQNYNLILIVKKKLAVQVALEIRGLFICKFAYLRFVKVYQNSIYTFLAFSFAYLWFLDKFQLIITIKVLFFDIQCLLPRYSRFQNSVRTYLRLP